MKDLTLLLGLLLVLASPSVAQLCGDCDLDSDVDIVDALTGAQHAVGLNLLGGQAFLNCDVNLTSSVDVVDALTIAQAATGLPVTLCGMSGGPAGTCGDPIPLTSGVPFMGTTVGGLDTDFLGCTSLLIFQPEKIHEISFTGTRTIRVQCNTTYQSAVSVRTGCSIGAPEVGCDATMGGTHTLIIPGQSGGTYYIWVDGSASGMGTGRGPYTLTVTIQ